MRLTWKWFQFHVDCRPQIRIVSVYKCNQPWIGINGQLADCFSKLLVLIRYNISVNYKQKQPSEFTFRQV